MGASNRDHAVASEAEPSSHGWSSALNIKQEPSYISTAVNQGDNQEASATNRARPGALNRVLPSIQVTSIGVKRERRDSDEEDLKKFEGGNKRPRR